MRGRLYAGAVGSGPVEPDRPGDRARPVRRDARDGITGWDAVRRGGRRLRAAVLCLVGRHLWAVRRNPDVGGARAVYQQCRRCGRERTDWALRGTFED